MDVVRGPFDKDLVKVRYLSVREYTYRAGDLDVKEGDLVEVPPTSKFPCGRGLAIVTSVESDYTGPTHPLIDFGEEWSEDA
jgi:hypothetical protein